MGTPKGDPEGGSPPGSAGRANLTAQATSGLSWSALSTAALVVANLGYTATISRLLDPTAFGLMAMANLVVLFAEYFVRMGLASALVQKPDLSDEEVRAASTAGILIGLLCLGLVWLLAPAVGVLFRAPDLAPVLRGLGISFLFMGWSMTGLGLLRRALRFRELAMISVGAYVAGYLVVGVGLALLGAGVWSLVAATVTSTAIQAVWQYALLRHPLRPVRQWRPYRAVCGYAARLSVAHVLDYVGSNLDTFTVARIATTAVVGQYSRAYYLVFQPLGNYLSAALSNVVFATLSRIHEDLTRLRRAYLSIMSLGALLVFPICVGMAVAAPELVAVVPGPPVAAGRCAGPLVRARRRLPRCLPVVAVTGRGAGRAEPVGRRAGRVPLRARRAHPARPSVPRTGRVGDRRRGGGRGSAALPRLPDLGQKGPGVGEGASLAGSLPRSLRQRWGWAGYRRCRLGTRGSPLPRGAHGTDHRWNARPGAVHPGVPNRRCPCRPSASPGIRRAARSTWCLALAPGASGPGESGSVAAGVAT